MKLTDDTKGEWNLMVSGKGIVMMKFNILTYFLLHAYFP